MLVLPLGVKVVTTHDAYDLDVASIAALPKGQYEPPMEAFAYGVRFYYTDDEKLHKLYDAVMKLAVLKKK
jgi:hypothetical protein